MNIDEVRDMLPDGMVIVGGGKTEFGDRWFNAEPDDDGEHMGGYGDMEVGIQVMHDPPRYIVRQMKTDCWQRLTKTEILTKDIIYTGYKHDPWGDADYSHVPNIYWGKTVADYRDANGDGYLFWRRAGGVRRFPASLHAEPLPLP